MSPSDLPFRRIVLEFSRSAHSAEAIQAAAELAELLHLDLLGRFVEDPGLAQLVRTPFAREFRMLEGEWRDLDSQSAAGSVELAIAAARRLFMQAAASSSAPRHFEVIRAQAAAEQRRSAQELVAIVQDGDADSALVSRLGVLQNDVTGALLLPRRKTRQEGPIIVIAAKEDERSTAVATQVAAAAQETLLHLGWPPDPSSAIPANARLVVVSSNRFSQIAQHMTEKRRGIPILVLRTNNDNAGYRGSQPPAAQYR